MKLSKYNAQYQEALRMIEEANNIIRYTDGTKEENYKRIDLACTMITEFEKVKNSYYKIARAEKKNKEIKVDEKELTKLEKFYDYMEKFDFIGKGFAYVKSKNTEKSQKLDKDITKLMGKISK